MTNPHKVTYCANGCRRANVDGILEAVFTTNGDALCDSCVYRLAKYVDSIGQNYPELRNHLLPGSVDQNPESKATKAPTAPIPLRLSVVDLADERHVVVDDTPILNVRGAVGVVQEWAFHVRLGRGFTGQRRHVTMTSELDTLVSSWEWALKQPWAGRMYGDLRVLSGQIAAAVGQYRRKPVGKCPTLIQRVNPDGELVGRYCGGALLIVDDTVICARCQRVWTSADLDRLGLMLADA